MNVSEWLRARPGKVRVVGGGSRARALPDAGGAQRLEVAAMDRIVRLDPGDQTCSVEPGVRRGALDAALAEHDLELPCLGDGTIGGLFASDPLGPAAGGAQSPRSLLLGVQAVLADGTPFRAGARVVKSVAGFDVHKLFVGSRGTLYVATELHLRLKPRPRAAQWFCNDGLSVDDALALLRGLRGEALRPDVLQVRRARDGGLAVRGRVVGTARSVAATVTRHRLRGHGAPAHGSFHVDGDAADEVVHGLALPSALPRVLAALPAGAPFAWLEGGRFEAALPTTAATDAFFTALPPDAATASVLVGAHDRRGRGTPRDPQHARIEADLKRTLDPDGILV